MCPGCSVHENDAEQIKISCIHMEDQLISGSAWFSVDFGENAGFSLDKLS